MEVVSNRLKAAANSNERIHQFYFFSSYAEGQISDYKDAALLDRLSKAKELFGGPPYRQRCRRQRLRGRAVSPKAEMV
jgi:hypothetical protein